MQEPATAVALPLRLPQLWREHQPDRRRMRGPRLLRYDLLQRDVQRPPVRSELRRLRKQLRRERPKLLWQSVRRSPVGSRQLRRVWPNVQRRDAVLRERNVQRVRSRPDAMRHGLRQHIDRSRQLRRVWKRLRRWHNLRQRDMQWGRPVLWGTGELRRHLPRDFARSLQLRRVWCRLWSRPELHRRNLR